MFQILCIFVQGYRDGTMDLKSYFGLWGLEPMQLFLFWLILKTVGTSSKHAAKSIIPKADYPMQILADYLNEIQN